MLRLLGRLALAAILGTTLSWAAHATLGIDVLPSCAAEEPSAPAAPDLLEVSPPAPTLHPPPRVGVDTTHAPASPGSLSGRIVDDKTGEPIEGALVRAWAWRRAWPDVSVRTDAEGRYEISAPPRGMGPLTVWHPRYAGESLRYWHRDFGETRLRHGLPLYGVVLAPDGSPAAGARVLLAWSAWADGARAHVGSWIDDVAVTADGRGRFRLGCVPPGAGDLLLGAIRGSEISRWTALPTGPPHNETPVVIQLVASTSVRGRVLREDGSASPHTVVEAFVPPSSWTMGPSGRVDSTQSQTDAHGVYELVGLPPIAIEIEARTDTPIRLQTTRWFVEGTPADNREDHTLTLPYRHRLDVVLHDEAGAPLADEGVVVLRTGDEGVPPLAVGQTDAAGVASLIVHRPGPWTVLRARPDGNDVLVQGLAPDATRFEARLPPTLRRALELQLKREEAIPPAYAAVEVWTPGADLTLAAAYVVRGTTDAEGRVTVRVPSEGPWDVRVLAASAHMDQGPPHEGRLERRPADGGVASVELTHGRTVRGLLLHHDGTPCARAHVELRSHGVNRPSVGARTDDAGAFTATFVSTLRGQLDLFVQLPGQAHHHLVHALGAPGPYHRLHLPPLVTLAGQVRASGGAPLDDLPRLVVRASTEADSAAWRMVPVETPTDVHGRYRLEGVPAGLAVTVDVPDSTFNPSSWAAVRPAVELVADAPSRLVEIEPRHVLSGHVSMLDRCQEDRVYVSSYVARAIPLRPDALPRLARMNEEWHFEIAQLPPGPQRVELRAVGDPGWSLLAASEVGAAASSVRLEMPTTKQLLVSLPRDDDDRYVQLSVFKAGTSELVARFATQNESVLFPVPDGTYDIAAQTWERCGFQQRVEGSHTVLALQSGAPISIRRRGSAAPTWDGEEVRVVARGPNGTWPLQPHGDGIRGGVLPGTYDIVEVFPGQPERVLARGVEAGSFLLDLEVK
ncbi:MAG: hypothetical protein AB7T63_11855 [Planctomycetota bacterium]